MNIAGILIHAHPDHIASVREHLLSVAGVEVHAVTDTGKIVVTLDEEDSRAAADKLLSLQDIPGVWSAAMIYHHFEDQPELIEQEASL